MTDFEFTLYDLVRRIQAADGSSWVHQVDIAARAVEEGLVEQTGVFQAVDILRPYLKKLAKDGYLKHLPLTINSYLVAKDLLTVMAARI